MVSMQAIKVDPTDHLKAAILSDTVKDNDGGVDGIADDGKHAGNKGRSHRPLKGCVAGENH